MPRSAADALYPDGPSNDQGPQRLAMLWKKKGEPEFEGFEGVVGGGKGGGGPGKAPELRTRTDWSKTVYPDEEADPYKAKQPWLGEEPATKQPWKPGDPITAKQAQQLKEFEQKPWQPGDPMYDKWASEAQSGEGIYKIAKSFIDKWSIKAKGMQTLETKEPQIWAYGGEHKLPIESINWLKLQNRYAKVDLPEKAIEQGFNPNMPIYKGGSTPELRRELKDPATKQYERGQFFAEDPMVAKWYGYSHEYVARPKNPGVVDMGGRAYNEEGMHAVIENARAKGHDLLVVKNIGDVGPHTLENQVVVINPAIVRSPQAKFDPGSMHISDVLAGILAAAGTAKVIKELDPDKKQ